MSSLDWAHDSSKIIFIAGGINILAAAILATIPYFFLKKETELPQKKLLLWIQFFISFSAFLGLYGGFRASQEQQENDQMIQKKTEEIIKESNELKRITKYISDVNTGGNSYIAIKRAPFTGTDTVPIIVENFGDFPVYDVVISTSFYNTPEQMEYFLKNNKFHGSNSSFRSIDLQREEDYPRFMRAPSAPLPLRSGDYEFINVGNIAPHSYVYLPQTIVLYDVNDKEFSVRNWKYINISTRNGRFIQVFNWSKNEEYIDSNQGFKMDQINWSYRVYKRGKIATKGEYNFEPADIKDPNFEKTSGSNFRGLPKIKVEGVRVGQLWWNKASGYYFINSERLSNNMREFELCETKSGKKHWIPDSKLINEFNFVLASRSLSENYGVDKSIMCDGSTYSDLF